VPVVSAPDPGAVALAAYAGSLGAKIDPQTLGLWLPLIGVLALELGAAFSVVLVRSVTAGGPQTVVAHAESPASTGDAVAHNQVAQPVNERKRAAKAKRRRDDDDDQVGPRKRGLYGLLDTVRANGGVIDLSQRKLARQIGASRTTLQRALNELAAAGAVMLETGNSGTRLALA
jgi:uncharacterized membrane protein